MQQNPQQDRFDPIRDPRPGDTPWPQMTWPIPAGTTLTGRVVELTPTDPTADAAELFRALDHDAVWAHVPGRPRDPAHFAEILAARCALPDWQPWTVRARGPLGDLPAGAAVGVTSYLDVSAHDARVEIGFTLYTPAVWAGAVNPETKLLLLGYAFDTLGAGRAQLKTDTRNHRSQQAIARLGATYEGTLRRHFRREDGTIRDSVMFAVTVDDWPDVRSGLESRLGA
ncbi:GNAT family N-acetyltransferase [Rhodococcus sp. NPDC058505]|uniref:GNAT family N-acetyltransferase n=1 Tax=unclassified Rhodococcus (in: high G+C Gram-positive bacteria) TaxID=192944 RepID=UPI00364C470A